MGLKVITKRIHDALDNFVSLNNQVIPEQTTPEQTTPERAIHERTKLKKNDGLIERVDVSKKIFIAEDNRQLLND
jgi:hypothetical protein